jgi:hypothetical protein
MNYYKARERKSDGRFNFTCMNDDRVWAVGYCHAFRDFTDEEREQWHISDSKVETHRSFASKYHTDGHATPEEAVECFKQYTLDHELQLGLRSETQMLKCAVCGSWTQLGAMVGHSRFWPLCASHNFREEVERLYKAPSEIASSD